MALARQILRQTFSSWRQHHVSRLGAALAYYAVFALAPILLIVVAAVGLVIGQPTAQHQVQGQLGTLIGSDGARLVSMLVAGTQRGHGGQYALAAGIALAFVTAIGLFMQLQDALDEIWEVPSGQKTGLWRTLLMRAHAIAIVGFLALIVGAALIAAEITGDRGTAIAVNVVALALFLTVTYHVLPQENVNWRGSVVAALISAVILAGGEALLALYLTKVRPGSTYGAAGAFIVVLLWIYYSSQLLLLGAELARVLEMHIRGLAPANREETGAAGKA